MVLSAMMQPWNRRMCLLAIVGALLLASHCKSHQMNISNTWTLPQDGFTVFYRFFRDKISWYEADAVCQFHHANLVTVDNGVKYDASRAYLSDLNVTENVWIGLMRSQNSDRFMWSNSKILDREFGYWAEQIPAIDSPLCAVVDPMRDYRWHSLRCGGPEIASFLCEMEAPEWATECLIRALPSLTIQYMADSATIELSRDCGTEGTKRLTCNGKQDQDLIQRELMCLSERDSSITSDNEMKATDDKLAFEGVEETSKSDNTENNNIDKIANQIEASVDKVDDKISLDDVMMGDAPIVPPEADNIKPTKNVKKIASEKPLKKQMRKMKTENKEELMMGDQAAVDIPPEEILPHVKKVINDDPKNSAGILSTPKSVLEIQQTTVEVRSRRETENPIKLNVSVATTVSPIKVEPDLAHTMAPLKEISRDHFIPPMLLVQHQNSTVSPASTDEEISKSTSAVVSSTSESIRSNETSSATQQTQLSTTANSNDLTTISSDVELSSTTIDSVSSTTQESTTVLTTTHQPSPHEYHKTNMMRPHAPKFAKFGEISYHAPSLPAAEKGTIDSTPLNESTLVADITNATEYSTAIVENKANTLDAGSSTVNISETSIEHSTQSQTNNETVTEVPHLEVAKRSNADKHQHKTEQQHKQDPQKKIDDMNSNHADFTNSNLDYQNYKPNRKRILTKPETHTFIQKVFG